MDAVDIDSDVIATIEQLKLDVEKLVLNYSVNTPEHLLDDKKMSIIVPENLHHNEAKSRCADTPTQNLHTRFSYAKKIHSKTNESTSRSLFALRASNPGVPHILPKSAMKKDPIFPVISIDSNACVVNTPLSTGHVKRDCINTEAKNQAQTNSKVGAVVDSSVSISNETTSPESSTACTITRSVDSVIARMSAASQPAMKSLTKPSKQKKRSISIKGRQDDKSSAIRNKNEEKKAVSAGVAVPTTMTNIVLPNQYAFLGPNGNIFSGVPQFYIKTMIPPTMSPFGTQTIKSRESNIDGRDIPKFTSSADTKHRFIQPKPRGSNISSNHSSINATTMPISANGVNGNIHVIKDIGSSLDRSIDNSSVAENVDTIRPKAAVKLYQRSRKATQKTDPMSKLELNGPNVARQIEENRQDEEENEPPPLLTQDEPSSSTSAFLRQAALIRDQIFASDAVRSPIKHELGGFIIEENARPFPCNRKRRSDRRLNPNACRAEKDKIARNRIVSSDDESSYALYSRGKRPIKKGRHRELERLLTMDFGKSSPFQTTSIDEYTKEVMIEQQQRSAVYAAVNRQSSESEQSLIVGSRVNKLKRERQKRRNFSPSQSRSPNRPSSSRSQSKELSIPSSKSRHRRNEKTSTSSNRSEKEFCLGCRKSFSDRCRDSENPQYCSKECRKNYMLVKRGRDENKSIGSLVNISREDSSDSLPLFERRSLDDSNDKSKSPLFGSQKRKPAITMHAERGVNTGSPLLNSTQRASSEITTPPDARNNALAYQQSPPVAPIPAFPYQANQQFHPSYFASVPSSPFFMGADPFQAPQQSIFSSQSAFQQQQPTPSFVSSILPPRTPGPTNFGGGSSEGNSELALLMAKGVHQWTPDDVANWANIVTNSESNGDRFIHQEIDGASLILLTSEQLQNELKFKLGPALKLYNALTSLKMTSHL